MFSNALMATHPKKPQKGKRTKKPAPPPEAPDKAEDRHKPSFMVRVPMVFAEPLDELTRLHVSDRTGEVIAAVRKYLESKGLWPRKTD